MKFKNIFLLFIAILFLCFSLIGVQAEDLGAPYGFTGITNQAELDRILNHKAPEKKSMMKSLNFMSTKNTSSTGLTWKSFFEDGEWTQNIELNDSIKSGFAYMPAYLSEKGYYFSRFNLDLGNTIIDGDDVALEFRAKNNTLDGGISAYDITLGFKTDNGNGARISLIEDISSLGIETASFAVGSESYFGVPELVFPLGDWHIYKIETKDKTYNIYKDGILIKSYKYNSDLGNLNKLVFGFKGSGMADWIHLIYKGKPILVEEFDEDGFTTAMFDSIYLATGSTSTGTVIPTIPKKKKVIINDTKIIDNKNIKTDNSSNTQTNISIKNNNTQDKNTVTFERFIDPEKKIIRQIIKENKLDSEQLINEK